MPSDRFAAAVDAIDAANAQDPNRWPTPAGPRPWEVVHAEMVSRWIRHLVPEPSEALLLAARGAHLRRWAVPRTSYPAGRAGYLRWRRDLHARHAAELGELLAGVGYPDEACARVGAIVRKEGLRHDPEVQALEDALCLTFLETRLGEVADRLDEDHVVEVLAKTARKMSAAGLAAAATIELDERGRDLLGRALAP